MTDERENVLGRLDSAQGIRDAMTASYQKHLRLISEQESKEQYLPPGTTPHHAALYSALETRHMTFGDGELPDGFIELEMFRLCT